MKTNKLDCTRKHTIDGAKRGLSHSKQKYASVKTGDEIETEPDEKTCKLCNIFGIL